ncbi:hypothetical protein JCM1841_006361 [Sporobolomyces salmonicolor]
MYSVPTPPPPGQPPSLDSLPCLLAAALLYLRPKPTKAKSSRKGASKAAAKFEPTQFRDAIVKHLSSCAPNDYDSISAKLDALGSQLDYHRYDECLIQILLVGGILAPGGSLEGGGVGRCTFSVVAAEAGQEGKVDVAEMRKVVGVFERLMRRYKYLHHPFADSYLKQILGYANKFTPVEQERLAVATALFVQTGLVPASTLGAVKKDHLIKDGTAQAFLTSFLKTYPAASEPLDPLLAALRKAAIADLEAYFPASKRNLVNDVAPHFKASGLASVADWLVKTKQTQVRDETTKKVKALVADDADVDDILAVLEPIHARAVPSVLPEGDFISLVFLALVSTLDLNAEPTAVVEAAVKKAKDVSGVLEPFSERAVTEVALINTIQLWCHDNPKLTPAFARILKTLYSTDVISTPALVYWHAKGSKPQGRETFLAKAGPLVKFLQEQEEDEESDEE